MEQRNRRPAMSKSRAKALLSELIAGFSSKGFRRKLETIATNNSQCEDLSTLLEHRKLALTIQREVLPRYGFDDGEAGVTQMLKAVRAFVDDTEIAAQWEVMNECLRIPRQTGMHCDNSESSDDEEATIAAGKSQSAGSIGGSATCLNRKDVIGLLQELLAGFSSDTFQWKLSLLREAQLSEPCNGPYLDGCEELALAVQRKVLPRYGFEGSRRGALSMSRECSKYLRDSEVFQLHTAIARELTVATSALC